MAELKKWEHPKNYMGETYYDYYPVIGQHRDSDDLDRSNFDSALKMLGGENDTVIVVRSGHWAVGWVESIMVHESDAAKLEIAQQIVDSLENYPVLDESDYSKKQWQTALDTWKMFSLKERVELCVKYDICIFAARHDELPDDPDGSLFEYLITP